MLLLVCQGNELVGDILLYGRLSGSACRYYPYTTAKPSYKQRWQLFEKRPIHSERMSISNAQQ